MAQKSSTCAPLAAHRSWVLCTHPAPKMAACMAGSNGMSEEENVFHCSQCHRAGIKSDKEMWSRRTRDMLHAKHSTSVNRHKLRCLECTAQDHSQDTRAMQRLCPGPKEYDTCNGCPKVLVHTEGPGCNVSKAQWKKRYGDRLCLACAPKKRASSGVWNMFVKGSRKGLQASLQQPHRGL